MENVKKFFAEHKHVQKVYVNDKGEYFTAFHKYEELTVVTRSEAEESASKKEVAPSK